MHVRCTQQTKSQRLCRIPVVRSLIRESLPALPQRLIPAVLIAVGVSLMVAGVDINSIVRNSIDRAGIWAPVVFVALGVAALTVLVPKTAVSVLSGAFFGTLTGSLLMLFVAVFAAAINYSLGRWWFRGDVERMLTRSRAPNWLRGLRGVAADAGPGFHLLVRMTPIPTSVISYTMGASGSRVVPFLVGAAAAVIPQSLWVHGGTVLSVSVNEGNTSAVQWIGPVVSIAAAILVAALLPRLVAQQVAAYQDQIPEGVSR